MINELYLTFKYFSCCLKLIFPTELKCIIKYLNYIKRTKSIPFHFTKANLIFAHTVIELDWRVARVFDRKAFITFCLAAEEGLCSSPLRYSWNRFFASYYKVFLFSTQFRKVIFFPCVFNSKVLNYLPSKILEYEEWVVSEEY